eukprot:scaffold123301_cov25-Tisochrysis_lutea.AAC.1
MPQWFCGREAAWQFFSAPLMPERCYFTSTISASTLLAAGLRVWPSEAECSCSLHPPPPSPPPQKIYFCGRPGEGSFWGQRAGRGKGGRGDGTSRFKHSRSLPPPQKIEFCGRPGGRGGGRGKRAP